MSVFILLKNTEGCSVVKAREYQESAYHTFMSNNNLISAEFNYPDNIKFTINKFNNTELNGDYKSFCELKNACNNTYILSNDNEKLKHFAGYINRLTNINF